MGALLHNVADQIAITFPQRPAVYLLSTSHASMHDLVFISNDATRQAFVSIFDQFMMHRYIPAAGGDVRQ